jgi:hypothetical protein
LAGAAGRSGGGEPVIGVAQFAIGLVMLAGYRRAGPWGEF